MEFWLRAVENDASAIEQLKKFKFDCNDNALTSYL